MLKITMDRELPRDIRKFDRPKPTPFFTSSTIFRSIFASYPPHLAPFHAILYINSRFDSRIYKLFH